jgi:hypothetical protein
LKAVSDRQLELKRKAEEDDTELKESADGKPKIGDQSFTKLKRGGDRKPKPDGEDDLKSKQQRQELKGVGDRQLELKRKVEEDDTELRGSVDGKPKVGDQLFTKLKRRGNRKPKPDNDDDGDDLKSKRPRQELKEVDDRQLESERKVNDDNGKSQGSADGKPKIGDSPSKNLKASSGDETAKKLEGLGPDGPNLARKERQRSHDVATVTAGIAVVVGLAVGLISIGSVFWIRRINIANNSDMAEADKPLLGMGEFCGSE